MNDKLFTYTNKGKVKYCKYKNRFINFLNKLFCKHAYKEYAIPLQTFLILSTNENKITLCSKCGKEKI